jgi:hypothetical protein
MRNKSTGGPLPPSRGRGIILRADLRWGGGAGGGAPPPPPPPPPPLRGGGVTPPMHGVPSLAISRNPIYGATFHRFLTLPESLGVLRAEPMSHILLISLLMSIFKLNL